MFGELFTCLIMTTWVSVTHQSDEIATITMGGYCPGTYELSPEAQLRIWTSYDTLYPPNMNCATTLKADTFSSRLMIEFKHFHVGGSHDCNADWLTIHDGPDTSHPVLGSDRYCGMEKGPSSVLTTSGDSLTLFFHSDSHTGYKGIEAIVTEFHTGTCESSEVSCRNGRCIDDALDCNGFNPCGDQSDCGQLSTAAVLGIVFGSVIVGSILIAICLSALRRWRIRQILKRHTIHHVIIANVETTRRHVSAQPPPYSERY